MAIIQCPSCGSNISDQATRCPKCGCQIQGNVNQFQGSTQGKDFSSLEWYMWVVLLLCGWVVDLIYYFVKKGNAPVRAKQSLICLWINLGIWLITLSLS